MEIVATVEEPKEGASWVRLRISGRLDSLNYEYVSERVSTFLRMGKRRICFDFEEMTSINLAAILLVKSSIGALMEREGGGAAVVASDSKCIERLSALLDSTVRFYSTWDEFWKEVKA